MHNATEEYLQCFHGHAPHENGIVSKAVECATATRNFEIELYWKRATYFWTFIAAAFAGYFALLGLAGHQEHNFPAFVVSCIGIFLTFSWFLVNKGSKFWQENWENHVGILSPHIAGPIFTKVLAARSKALPFGWITGASPISVSKVNQWVSTFMLFVWFILMLRVAPIGATLRANRFLGFLIAHRFMETFLCTAAFGGLMFAFSKTTFGTHECKGTDIPTRVVK
jgi:hypothetical protein